MPDATPGDVLSAGGTEVIGRLPKHAIDPLRSLVSTAGSSEDYSLADLLEAL